MHSSPPGSFILLEAIIGEPTASRNSSLSLLLSCIFLFADVRPRGSHKETSAVAWPRQRRMHKWRQHIQPFPHVQKYWMGGRKRSDIRFHFLWFPFSVGGRQHCTALHIASRFCYSILNVICQRMMTMIIVFSCCSVAGFLFWAQHTYWYTGCMLKVVLDAVFFHGIAKKF